MMIPRPPIAINTYGQPKAWVIQPINGVKITAAKYCDELKTALAVPRSAVGNHVEVSLELPGNAGASAAPTRNRSAASVRTAMAAGSKTTKPCKAVNIDQ